MAKAGFGARMALAGAVALVLSGCAAVHRNHGYAPSEAELAEITVGTSTRETVAQAIGRPATGGVMADSGWYYVESRWRHYGARPPEEIEREVVAVSFDAKGVVENVERFGLADGRVVPISRRVTESNVRGIGVIQQLLGNLGNFNPGQFLGGRRS